MISILTPDGAKNLVLRGVLSPRGKKAVVSGGVTTPVGDKQFWDGSSPPGFAVSASPFSAVGSIALLGIHPVSTNIVTVTASGGSAPYAYAWSLQSDDGFGGAWSAADSSSSQTRFTASAVEAQTTSTAIFRCTVTDARGAVSTVDVTAIANNFGKY